MAIFPDRLDFLRIAFLFTVKRVRGRGVRKVSEWSSDVELTVSR